VLGRADEARAEVWLRCPPPAGVADSADALEVTGTLSGPRSATAATLPATYALVDQGTSPGRAPLARCVCTEPSYWTPDVPSLYEATVELRRGGRVVAAGRRWVGLRRAGVRQGSIRLDGFRFVPRALGCDADPRALEGLRAASCQALVGWNDLSEALSEAADRTGVGIVVLVPPEALLAEAEEGIATRLESLAAHPSTLLVVLGEDEAGRAAGVAALLGRARGSMLLGLESTGAMPPPACPGFDLRVARLGPGAVPHDGWRRSDDGLPRLARETVPADGVGPCVRADCDALQARLAAWSNAGGAPVDWAGYLVG